MILIKVEVSRKCEEFWKNSYPSHYLAFSEGSPPSDIKEFNAYQGACKSALLHIALLVKLTQNQTPVDTVIPDLSALLEQAKKELSPNDFSGISVDLG